MILDAPNTVICKDLVYKAEEEARGRIGEAVERAMKKGALPNAELPAYTIEIPADASHGDFACNVALVSARALNRSPRDIAAAILEELELSGGFFDHAETAGPGFLNLFLNRSWFSQVVRSILLLGDAYGRTNYGKGEKIMVEFVSANPTGPMHMGNARGGALGDCLAAALDAAGYDVTREFYVNDAGNQIAKLGLSLEVRYIQHFRGEDAAAFPEDGYQGEDVREWAAEAAERFGESLLERESEERRQMLLRFVMPRNIDKMREDLFRYRINYESWFHESSLYDSGTINLVVSRLRERQLTYEKDGALWYKATAFGAEKDEVLIRQNGHATYFAADIAYHYNKFAVRGFSKVIDVWGADHHGHVARLKGALDAIGLEGNRLEIVLLQLVRMMKDGEPYRMSKRTGRSITLTDLLEEIPVDAARFFFIMREPGSALDFDLDLAAEQSSQNPVYYVQYAHARICSILARQAEEGVTPRECSQQELSLLIAPEEVELIRLLARCPGEIIEAAEKRDPARLTHYLTETATRFHKFYTACHVRVEEESLMQARLSLCVAAKATLSNMLTLLGISAPESM